MADESVISQTVELGEVDSTEGSAPTLADKLLRLGRALSVELAIAWFAIASLLLIRPLTSITGWGTDAVLYAASARAWLTGGDPWHTSIVMSGTNQTVFFGAPPTDMILYAPFAWLPAQVVGILWVILDVLAVLFIVRRLKKPLWWLLFPPAVEASVVGNPEPVMLALLVAGWPVLNALAPLAKPYAAAGLLAERRWRALAVAAGIGAACMVILPWPTYFAELREIVATLRGQLHYGDLSAWGLSVGGIPIFVPIAVASLVVLGWRRAWWLAVPVLWPMAQWHYAVIAMPVLGPVAGLGFSIPIPGATTVTVVALALMTLPKWLRDAAAVRRQASTDAGVSGRHRLGYLLATSIGAPRRRQP